MPVILLAIGGGWMADKKKKRDVLPEQKPITDFQKGQTAKLFAEIAAMDKTVVVNKHSKPLCAVISYERYKRLKEEGVDI